MPPFVYVAFHRCTNYTSSFLPSESLPLRDRCFLVAKILKHQLRFPNLSPLRTWNRKHFAEMLSVVPNDLYEPSTLDFIWPGPGMPLFHPPPSQSPKFAPVLSGEHLVTAGLDIAQNIFNRRWLGPFLPSKKFLKVQSTDGRTFINPPNFLPYFFVPKPSGPPRWISDAARPVENWEQHQPSPSAEWMEFNGGKPICSLNDATLPMEVEFERINVIIRALISSSNTQTVISGADAHQGYKQIIRRSDSFHLVCYFLKFELPDGSRLDFWVANVNIPMGWRRSAQIFEKCFQLFTLILVFNFPNQYTSDKEALWRKLYSWLDDALNSNSAPKLHQSFQAALQAYLTMRWTARYVGIILSKKKDEPPSQIQNALGFRINTISKLISLKPGKALAYAHDISTFLQSGNFCLESLERLHGKLNHTSFILPVLKSLLPPLTEAYTSTTPPSKSLIKEVHHVLSVVVPLLQMDPAVTFKRFKGIFPRSFPVSYTDAAGFTARDRALPGGIAGVCPQFKGQVPSPFRNCFWWTAWPLMIQKAGLKRRALSHLHHRSFPSSTKNGDPHKPPIAYLELLGFIMHFLVLTKLFRVSLENCTLIFNTDSTAVLFWGHKFRLARYPWYRLIAVLPLLEFLFDCRVLIRWIPSELQLADGASRGKFILHTRDRTLHAVRLPKDFESWVLRLLFNRAHLQRSAYWSRLKKKLATLKMTPIMVCPPLPPVPCPSFLFCLNTAVRVSSRSSSSSP